MVDHPRRIFKQICICDDILLDCFRLLAPAKVGLALALVSDRFDVLADTHFRSRKWPIGNLGICRGKNGAAIHNQKGGEGRTAAVKRLLPIPQVPLPNGVVGFGRIGLGYIDGTVIAFLRRIRRLFHTNGVTLELSFSSVEGRSCDAFASSIWPLLNAAAIVEMRFKVNNNLGYLRSRLSPSILRDCANLRLISICYGLFPQFPPDDRPGATDGQAVCKWLHTAQAADGQPKVLRCALGRAFSMEALKTAFLNATTSVGFIIVARWYCRVVPFELENGLTREQLALRNIRHDWWLMERAAIGRNARQWAEWEREALGENGQQGRQSGRNVLVFRAYDDDIGALSPSAIN